MKRLLSIVLSLVMIFSIIPMNVFAAAKLSAPTVTLSNVASTGKIKVSWTKVSGAYVYEVYRATSKNGTYKNVITKSSTSYINTSTTVGKTYYYKVRAVSSSGAKGSFSAVKYRTCDLARPEVKATTNSNGYPKLTWGKISGAESYKVYRATSKTGTYKLMKTTTSTSYTNTSAESGKTYYYKVKAVCSKSAADSAYSTVVSVKAKNKGNYSRTFVMGIDPEYPPFTYYDEKGNPTGFDVEVCKAVCDYLGWNFKTFDLNWDNKFIQLDVRQCDCIWSAMTILDSMKEAGYVLSDPYFENEQVFVVKKSKGFNSSDDLKNRTVGVQLGTTAESCIYEGYTVKCKTVKTFDSNTASFNALKNNSVDAVFADKAVAEEYVSMNDGYKIIDEDIWLEQYGVAFRSGDADLCEQVEKAISVLVKNGTYAKIAGRYPELKNNLIYLY